MKNIGELGTFEEWKIATFELEKINTDEIVTENDNKTVKQRIIKGFDRNWILKLQYLNKAEIDAIYNILLKKYLAGVDKININVNLFSNYIGTTTSVDMEFAFSDFKPVQKVGRTFNFDLKLKEVVKV